MVNEISAGLGVRQPVSQQGGSTPLGAFLISKSGNLNQFVLGGAGSVLQVSTGISLGSIVSSIDIIAWFEAYSLNVTALGTFTGSIVLHILVRDATILSNPTPTQFANATTAVSTPTPISPGATGKFYTSALPVAVNSFNPGNTDSYGNIIASGDSLVADVGFVSGQIVENNLLGTWALKVWYTANAS